MPENLPRVGSALIVTDEANRILLGKRSKDPQRGSWVIPGGKIHAFETIADAARRELQEETGLLVSVGHQFGVYEVINPPDEHRLVIYSWGRLVDGTPVASDDLSEVRFFAMGELGQVPTTPLVTRVLQDAGFLRSEFGPSLRPWQLNLFGGIPLPLAGAREKRAKRKPRRTPHARRGSMVVNTPLLFDLGPHSGGLD